MTLDLAGIAFVSDISRSDSRVITAPTSKTLHKAIGVGFVLAETLVGSEIEARTANNVYRLAHAEPGMIEISGHPEYCPQPVRIPLGGTRWLDQSSKGSFLAPGMSLQFIDLSGRSVLTSRIQSLRVIA